MSENFIEIKDLRFSYINDLEEPPVKTEVPTPAPTPGPTPIPRDDPSSLWYISSHSSSMTVANIDGGFDHRAGIDKGVLYL